MNALTHVLYVDDSSFDRQLVRDALEREHTGFILTEAGSKREFEKELEEGVYDVVLSDFNILGFEGFQVIEAVRMKAPHVPVVILTGTGSEEVAVEAMKSGAADYIIKTPRHIQRLPSAILAAVEKERLKVERDKALEEMRKSEEAFRSLFENNLDATLLTTPDGGILRVNLAACRMFGLTEEEFSRARRDDVVDTSDPRLLELLEKRRLTSSASGELNFRRKDGTIFPAEVSSAIFVDSKGNQKTSMTIRDISERKRASEELRQSRQRLELALAGGDLGCWDRNLETGEVVRNRRWAEMLGFSLEEIEADSNAWEKLIHPEDRARVLQEFNELLQGRTSQYESEYRMRSKAGQWKRVLDRGKVVEKDATGRPLRVAGTHLDVTERRKVELERDRLFNLSIDMLCIAGFDGYFRQLNPAWSKTLGWSNEELLSKPWIEFAHPEDRDATETAGFDLIEGKPIHGFENRLICKDGSYRWISWNSFPLPEEGLIFGVARDVTDRKNVEIELRRSEEKYRTIFEHSPVGIYHFDDNGVITACNDFFVSIIGSSPEKLIGLNTINDLRDKQVVDAIKEALSSGKGVYEGDYTSVTARKVTPIRAEFRALRAGDGSVTGGIAIVQDFTERKKAENALRESEKKYRLVVEHANEGIVVVQDTKFRFVNPKMEELSGYERQDLLNKDFRDFVYEGDRDTVLERHELRIKGEDVPDRYPVRIIHRDGSIRGWISARTWPTGKERRQLWFFWQTSTNAGGQRRFGHGLRQPSNRPRNQLSLPTSQAPFYT
jgi:PAS domain S-box-containing protein